MDGASAGVTRSRAVLGGVLVVLGASAAAWAVAYPQGTFSATVVRALADCCAAVTLGLAVVPLLDARRYRDELTKRAGRPLAWAAGSWLLAELCRMAVGAASAEAVPVWRVGLGTTAQFAMVTSAGRSSLFGLAAAAVVLIVAVIGARTSAAAVAATGIAAVGLVARTVGGHMSESAIGAPAIALHVVAAATWCGALAALVLTVDHRGQWARVLPRFSDLSLWCVIALLSGGLIGAVVAVSSPAQLFATGYGRVLLIKIVLTVVLIVLARRNRGSWLPAAKSHRVTAYASRSRSLTELAIMAVALTMAGALSVTG